MQIRESLNNNPVLTGIGTIVVLGLSILVVTKYGCQGGPKLPPPVNQYYFTTDDGKTYFPADRMKVPPFKTDDGLEAVRAHVYVNEQDKTLFVGFLERFNEVTKAKIEGADPRKRAMMEELGVEGQEVKAPGEANRWVGPRREEEFRRIREVKEPRDPNKYAREVLPGQK